MTESFVCLNGRQILGGTRGRRLGVVPLSFLVTGRSGCISNSNVPPPNMAPPERLSYNPPLPPNMAPPERLSYNPPLPPNMAPPEWLSDSLLPPFGVNRNEHIDQISEGSMESYLGDKRFSKSGRKDEMSKLASFGFGGSFFYSNNNDVRSNSDRLNNFPSGGRGSHGFRQSAAGGGGRGSFNGDSSLAPNNSANPPFNSGGRGGLNQPATGGGGFGGLSGNGSRGGYTFGQQQQRTGSGFIAGTESRESSWPFGSARGGFTASTENRDENRSFSAGRDGFGHDDLNNRSDDSTAFGMRGGRAFGQQSGVFAAGTESLNDIRPFGAGRGGRGGYGHSDSNNQFDDRGGGFCQDSNATDQRENYTFAGDRRKFGAPPTGSLGGRVPSHTENAELNSLFPTATSYVLADCKVEELFEADRRNALKYRAVADDDEDIIVGEGHKEMSTAGIQADVCAIDSWKDAKFHPIIAANIEKANYDRPRKIQAYAIPIILGGLDVRVHAETGSGKTVAFMAPIIDRLIKAKLVDTVNEPRANKLDQPRPKALVIEPTRELCLQVYGQGLKLASGSGIAIGYAYGEYPYFDNYSQLQKGCEVLCATPGRLITLLTGPFQVDLSQLKYFVLDKADRLLDGSFILQLRKIIFSSHFPSKENRQTMLLSATFPEEVQRLANDVLRDDIFLSLKNRTTIAANSRIVQNFFEVQSCQKKEFLMEILRGATNVKVPTNVKRTLIFVNTKHSADLLALYLSQNGLKATTINADRSQKQRELALKMFHDNDIRILVSTDVCARGIDVNEMDHVINYDLPTDPVTYVHRIGRTGRLCSGFSTSFVDMTYDKDLIPALVQVIREAGQNAPEFMKNMHGLDHPRADDQVSLWNRPSACGFVTSGVGAAPTATTRLPTIPDVAKEPDDTWGEHK